MTKQVTFQNIGNGYFSVLADGAKTQYMIENMDAGRSGNAKNEYGIFNEETGKSKRIGSLAACKKEVARWINPAT